MDATTATSGNSTNSTNPPSIELAYKKKCIQLKKRLNEIEAENDLIRARNKRAKFYVAKMRLETCIMLERLATVTGMLDEAATAASSSGAGGEAGPDGKGQISSELRAKAAAIVKNAKLQAQESQEALDDETEGSSEDQPPTPQERPLRVKRSRKSNVAFEEIEAEAAMQYDAGTPDKRADSNDNPNDGDDIQEDDLNNDITPSSPPPEVTTTKSSDKEALPGLAPATTGASEERRSSGFRAVNKADSEAPVPMDVDDEKPSKSED